MPIEVAQMIANFWLALFLAPILFIILPLQLLRHFVFK